MADEGVLASTPGLLLSGYRWVANTQYRHTRKTAMESHENPWLLLWTGLE